MMTNSQTLTFFSSEVHENSGAAFVDIGISAGFPSPAEDFVQERVSLDKILIKNQEATFFARVSGQSMIDAGINDKDLLVIDRSLEPINNKIAVCFIDGEFTDRSRPIIPSALSTKNPATASECDIRTGVSPPAHR